MVAVCSSGQWMKKLSYNFLLLSRHAATPVFIDRRRVTSANCTVWLESHISDLGEKARAEQHILAKFHTSFVQSLIQFWHLAEQSRALVLCNWEPALPQNSEVHLLLCICVSWHRKPSSEHWLMPVQWAL